MDKNMKVVILTSSARDNSFGNELAHYAKDVAIKTGTQAEIIDLYTSKLEFCTGCLKCMEHGKCIINDNFESIKSKLYEADGIILCSPTYCGSYNAVMKNFIDRLGLYERFTSSLGDKYVCSISTAGDGRLAKQTAASLAKLLTSGVFQRGYISGAVGISARFDDIDNSDKANQFEAVEKLSKKLVDDIKTNKKYVLQNVFNRLLSKLVLQPIYKRMITKNKDANTKGVYDSLVARGLI